VVGEVGIAICVAGASGVGTGAPDGMVRVAHTVSPALVQVLVVVYIGMAASYVGDADRTWVCEYRMVVSWPLPGQ